MESGHQSGKLEFENSLHKVELSHYTLSKWVQTSFWRTKDFEVISMRFQWRNTSTCKSGCAQICASCHLESVSRESRFMWRWGESSCKQMKGEPTFKVQNMWRETGEGRGIRVFIDSNTGSLDVAWYNNNNKRFYLTYRCTNVNTYIWQEDVHDLHKNSHRPTTVATHLTWLWAQPLCWMKLPWLGADSKPWQHDRRRKTSLLLACYAALLACTHWT